MNVQDLLTNDATPFAPAMSVAAASSGSLDTVKRGWVAPFLLHLHQMLRRESPRIIRWAEDGLAFQILDKEAMTTQILPKYFKNKNFASFQRQLNYFGFRKWSKVRAEFPTYGREHFTRDNFSEMSLVKRQTKKPRKRKVNDEEQQAKRVFVVSSKYGKCKPILPRLPNPSTFQTRFIFFPVQSSPMIDLPALSPPRNLNSGYKLPSIHELSMFSAAIGSIRPRLMA